MAGYGEHDVARIAVNFCGIIFSGYGKEAVLTIEPNSDHRESRTGADGWTVCSQLNDESAIVSVSFMEGTPTHRALQALYNLDKATRGGAGVGVFEMRDLINGDVDSSPRAWIMRRPDKKVAPGGSEYEWKLGLSQWKWSFPA
jgi:hypothetical protein